VPHTLRALLGPDHRVLLPASILGGGHGASAAVSSGVMISTRKLQGVAIDGEIATIGAGERWSTVIARAAEHELLPIAGSSPDVGVVGYLLGGGLGPLARSHGFSSDYATEFTVVTGTGAIVRADREHAPDLFFALRGGKYGFGVVMEARVRLVPLRTLYAGSIAFAPGSAERALLAWIDWTGTADPRVSTSFLLAKGPNERSATLRFAFPGSIEEGEMLARAVRAFAPVQDDRLGPLAVADIARIHEDPTEPVIAFTQAAMLSSIDHRFATALVEATPSDGPFVGCEIRHLGEATMRDVPEGSAVGGRAARFALGAVAVGPTAPTDGPPAGDRMLRALEPWIAAEGNANFLSAPRGPKELATAWSAETIARLERIRRRYDPDGVFDHA